MGGDHSFTLVSLSRLGMLLGKQGALEEAEGLARRALDGSKRTYGSRHSETLKYMNNLISLVRKRGKPKISRTREVQANPPAILYIVVWFLRISQAKKKTLFFSAEYFIRFTPSPSLLQKGAVSSSFALGVRRSLSLNAPLSHLKR